MPYVIALVIIIIAAGALLLFREPVEAPAVVPDEVRVEETTPEPIMPDGFTPPTGPPPSGNLIEQEAIDTAPTTETQADTGASGTFTGEASYSTGRAVHELDVTLTLENNIVVAADVDYDDLGEPPTPILRSFNEAYQAEVVGKEISEVQLSRVGGASWTSDAFNEAVAEIEAQL